jgi:hypothetical protein
LAECSNARFDHVGRDLNLLLGRASFGTLQNRGLFRNRHTTTRGSCGANRMLTQNCNENPTHAPTNAPSMPKLDRNRHLSAKFRGWPAEGMREGSIGERTNDQTCNRPRAVFLHVCVRHWHRDRCRKLAHLRRSASAGQLNAVVAKPTPNFLVQKNHMQGISTRTTCLPQACRIRYQDR